MARENNDIGFNDSEPGPTTKKALPGLIILLLSVVAIVAISHHYGFTTFNPFNRYP